YVSGINAVQVIGAEPLPGDWDLDEDLEEPTTLDDFAEEEADDGGDDEGGEEEAADEEVAEDDMERPNGVDMVSTESEAEEVVEE
ncbi:MAG: hypothetical protein JSV56_07345, partial [Methanomassiliicoccales archaeon]